MAEFQYQVMGDIPILGSAAAPIDLTDLAINPSAPARVRTIGPINDQSTSTKSLAHTPEIAVKTSSALPISTKPSPLSTPPKSRKRNIYITSDTGTITPEAKTKTPWVSKYATSVTQVVLAGELSRSMRKVEKRKFTEEIKIWKARKNASADEKISWVKEERGKTVSRLNQTKTELRQYHIRERRIQMGSPHYRRNAPWDSGHAPLSAHDELINRKKHLEREIKRMTEYIGDKFVFEQEEASRQKDKKNEDQDPGCRDCNGGFYFAPSLMHSVCSRCGQTPGACFRCVVEPGKRWVDVHSADCGMCPLFKEQARKVRKLEEKRAPKKKVCNVR